MRALNFTKPTIQFKKCKNIFPIPVTDYTFKQIFATERNKHFLINFLNSAISKYVGVIADITYLPTEKYGFEASQKRVFFDIACKDTTDREFIIEMQRAQQPEFVDRSIYYLSRAISAGMKRGDDRYHLLPVYSVNLLDFNLPNFTNTDDCFSAVFLKDQKNEILTDKVGIFYLNLCNFAAQQEDISPELRQWLYVLKNMQYFDETDYAQEAGIFKELLDECRISKLNDMEKEEYHKSVLEYEDVQEAIAYAKELAAEEAYGLGREEGIEEGIEKGIEKGREEGRQSLLLTAKNFLAMGIPLQDVLKATGLSEAEVKSDIC